MRVEIPIAVTPQSFLMSCAAPNGEPVVNRAGEMLGELAHVVVDASTGTIAYAIVARGGVLGLGDRYHPIPWSALDVEAGMQRFVLDIDGERLDAAPGFDEDHWPEMDDHDWRATVLGFYGQKLRHL